MKVRNWFGGLAVAAGILLSAGCVDAYGPGRDRATRPAPDSGPRTPRLGDKSTPPPNKADDPATWYQVSVKLMAARDYRGALAAIEKAKIMRPAEGLYWYQAGVIFMVLNEFPRAEAEFRESLRLNPEETDRKLAIGVALLNQKRFDEALALFREVLQDPLYPTPWRAYANIGFIYVEQGQADDALWVFKKALEGNPDMHEGHEAIGKIYYGAGKFEDAEYHFMRATSLLRTSKENLDHYGPEYFFHLGECELKLNKNREAYEAFSRCRELGPETPWGIQAREMLKRFQSTQPRVGE